MWITALIAAVVVAQENPKGEAVPVASKGDISISLLANGDFEGRWRSLEGAGTVPEGWVIKGDTGPAAHAIGRGIENGPTRPGSQSLRWAGPLAGSEGHRFCLGQDLSIDMAEYGVLVLTLDLMQEGRDEPGGGAAPDQVVEMVLHFKPTPSESTTQTWKFTWPGAPTTGDDASGDRSQPNPPSRTKLALGQWERWVLDLHSEIGSDAEITGLELFLGGRGTATMIDNVHLEGTPAPRCPGDLDGNGQVDPIDAEIVRNHFGCEVNGGNTECDAADVTEDGRVNPIDLGKVMARYGACPQTQ